MYQWLRVLSISVALPLFSLPCKALDIIVSIPPQIALVKAIAGENAKTQALLTPGSDEHTYQPSVRQLTTITRASFYFRSGLPFEEGLVPKLQSMAPGLKIVDMTRDISRISATDRDISATHQGHAGGTDPHLWLDPILLKEMGKNICDAMIASDGGSRATYEKRYQQLAAKLDEADANIRKILAPYKGRRFLAFHPSFGYFAARYNLSQEAIEIEGKEPSPSHLHQIVERAKKEQIDTIITQPQFSDKSALAIASAMGGKTVSMDTMAPDVIANLESFARTLATTFERKGGAPSR